MRRTGGIAGFDDTIVLRANGQILVETRTVRGRSCLLGAAQQRQLLAALSTLRLGVDGSAATPTEPVDPVGSGDGETNDPITIRVTDVHARPVDLSDPSWVRWREWSVRSSPMSRSPAPATTSCKSIEPSGVIGAG